MEYEIISILADKASIGTITSTVKSIQFKNPILNIGSPRYGQLSNKMIISYKVPKNQYMDIVKAFAMRDIKIITRDEDALNIINSRRSVFDDKTDSSSIPLPADSNDNKFKKTIIKGSELEEIAKKGNYQEVLRVSKDINNYGTDVVEKARLLFPESVLAAVNSAYTGGMAYQSKVDDSVELLIRIASDQNLKSMNKLDIMKSSGLYAVELCIKHLKYIDKLIAICNNNSIPHIINLKAAVKFSEVVFENAEQFKDDLDIAVRDLNNKWLYICNDIAGHELSEGEKADFNKLLDYVQSKR